MLNEEKRWAFWAVVAILAFALVAVLDGVLGYVLVCILVVGAYVLQARLNIDKSNDD